MNVQIISGSARTNSMTKRIALHLYDRLAEDQSIKVGFIDMQDHHLLPVEEVWSAPATVAKPLQGVANAVFAADAFILVSPEYNGSYSPALKNFLDHFPKQERKVFGIVTASPGSLGGIRAALQLQSLVFALSGIGSPRMLIVPELDKKFGEAGELLDEGFNQNIESFLKELIWLSGAIHNAKRSKQVEPVTGVAHEQSKVRTDSYNRLRVYQKAVSLILGVALAIGLGLTHPFAKSGTERSGQEIINQMMPALIKNQLHKMDSQRENEHEQIN